MSTQSVETFCAQCRGNGQETTHSESSPLLKRTVSPNQDHYGVSLSK
jgi:hypothetical protein